ncbi:AAA family ATPase [Massilia sp. TN1-12]|uniref:AAA family ATPase n=1 Tax=Massilia paldalensis TaxID=3377675 RepID=UPI00384F9EDF
MIGLIGGHRVGKTSLAKAYAEKNDAVFLETSVSSMFKDMGHDPAGTFDFATRLTIQEEILKRLDVIYAAQPVDQAVITDRTPIDLLGYTMAEAVGMTVTPELQDRFDAYVRDCFRVLNKRFATVVLVQPGIPLVAAEGKAAMNKAYIEHLNSIMFGLMMDERTRPAHYYIRRTMLDFDDRLAALESAVGKAERLAHDQVGAYITAGGLVH